MVRDTLRQEPKRRIGGLLGPVEILDRQDQRIAAGHREDQVAQCPEYEDPFVRFWKDIRASGRQDRLDPGCRPSVEPQLAGGESGIGGIAKHRAEQGGQGLESRTRLRRAATLVDLTSPGPGPESTAPA